MDLNAGLTITSFACLGLEDLMNIQFFSSGEYYAVRYNTRGEDLNKLTTSCARLLISAANKII
jgi:hypothetical protein